MLIRVCCSQPVLLNRLGCFVAVFVPVVLGLQASAQVLPPAPFPPENLFTQEKADLGKVLFWDEQLSSDNTMSCGTCHQPAAGGADERFGTNPGFDNLFGTDDDIIGSPGMISQDSSNNYVASGLFGLEAQVTNRHTPPVTTAMFMDELFWDGRAELEFFDPITGELLIPSGGALENLIVGPPVNNVEMGHQGRSWSDILVKLAGARPMALGSDLPSDMASFIAQGETYPELFEIAFGDSELTAGRVAMAMATYMRTLVPDQSPFDLFEQGDTNALTPQQQIGLTVFAQGACTNCHSAPLFTEPANFFFNTGIRRDVEDLGRFIVTESNFDRGRFKVPSLRNVGLLNQFMHTGSLGSLEEIMDFYAHRNGLGPIAGQNLAKSLRDPIVFSASDEVALLDFLSNGLTDPRVASESFPFDRPMLYSEQAIVNPAIIELGTAGSGGFVPEMLAVIPPNVGNAGFKIGVNRALGGAQAWVALSSSAPVGGVVAQDQLLGPITLDGSGNGSGFGTMHWAIPDDQALDGQNWYMQWRIADGAAVDGISLSPVADFTIFCSMNGACGGTVCLADINGDGDLNFFDVSAFLSAFSAMDSAADFTGDGQFNFFDVSAFLSAFAAGCP